MSDSKKTAKAEKKAAKAEKKALQAAKKVAKAEKRADKAARKMAKSKKKAGVAPAAAAPVTKKAAVFGHPVRNLLIAALVAVVLGVVFILPQLQGYVYYYCCYAVGGLLALFGLVYIILYFARRPVSGEYHYEFGFGLVAILAGAYVALSTMLFPGAKLPIDFSVLVQFIGILVVLDGILKLQYMLDLGRMGYKKWWILLITSILGIALGVGMVGFLDYITYYSTAYGLTLMLVLGAAYCLNAVLDLISLIVVAVRNRKANKAAALAEAEAKVAASAAAAVEEEPVEEVVILVEEPVEEPVIEEAPVVVEAPAPVEDPAEEPVIEPVMAATAEE